MSAAIRSTADSVLDSALPKAQAFQEAHRQAKGIYWQGVRVPESLPVDGAKVSADKSRKPFYQDASWADRGFALPARAEFSLSIDTFDGPDGKAWTATASYVWNGELWSRTVFGGGDFQPPISKWTASPIQT